jgi:hypothetical protein
MAARGRLRASDADRDKVIEELKAAFTQGRLAKDELESRAGQAFTARTYAELAAATDGIPAKPIAPVPARPALAGARAWPPAELVAQARGNPLKSPGMRALRWGLVAGTIMLAAMVAMVLVTGNKDLFSATVLPLMADSYALVIYLNTRMIVRHD